MQLNQRRRVQRSTILTLLLLQLLTFYCAAQTVTISGKVTDKNNQKPILGVSVRLQNSKIGTSTDEQGNYILKVEKGIQNGAEITFTSIGYASQTVRYAQQNKIDVQLSLNSSELNEVVVTALGIKRQSRSLGYATTTITSEQVNDARSNNFVQALSGKVAGLNLVSSGSGPVNSTRIVLRGENSMDPNKNNALVVVDGIPLTNEFRNSGVGDAYQAGSGNDVPVDFGNGIADINPDDIESISVLKGASATALYGNRAGNGAIIITTKSGKTQKGIGITWNSNFSVNDILKDIDYQYDYGQGTGNTMDPQSQLYYSYGNTEDGKGNSGTSSAFGPRLDGTRSFFQYDPQVRGTAPARTPWVAYKNNRSDFWQMGQTLTNNISIDGGSDKANARVSLTHSKNKWIMPNTGYDRLTAALSFNMKPSARLTISSKINFTNKNSDNLPATGYNNQSISYFMIFQNPNVDLNWYRDRWKPDLFGVEQTRPFSGFIDNPFVIAYDMTNAVNGYKTVGNIQANYELSNKFNLMLRSGLDLNMEERETKRPFGTANFQFGYFKTQNIQNVDLNTDVLLSYKDHFLDGKLDLTATAGGNIRKGKLLDGSAVADGLVTPNVYKFSNSRSQPIYRRRLFREQTNSVYGTLTLGYKNVVYVDVTARNDWSSTLPPQNNSFFYPSLSTSFILSEVFKMPEIINYTKLRLSVAKAGNGTSPYSDRKYYQASVFASSASVPTTIANSNLLPENTTSFEAGLEYAMLQNRVRLDLNGYFNTTDNQILSVPIDYVTGFSTALINSGSVRNKGLEVSLITQNIKNKTFNWTSTFTWAANRNKVLSLAEGFTDQQIVGTAGNATYIAKVGGSTGDMYGFKLKRNESGQIIYKDGLPVRPSEIELIGNVFAKWKGGFNNEFTYRNYSLSFLLDGQMGGMIYSQTHHKLSEQGKLKTTLEGREEGFIIGDGVVLNADGTYSPNTQKVAPGTYYAEYYRRANVETNSFDASFLKLREVRIDYKLPQNILKKVRLQNAVIGLYGRDLAVWTKFPIYDPEVAALNGSILRPGAEIGQMPTTRTFGMNLTIKL